MADMQVLAQQCRDLFDAAQGSLGWFHDNARLVGNQLPALQRAFKRHAVEARTLANAASRPMSVGVFGASQAGKSFLIGRLISPPQRPTQVVFGEGQATTRLNFLTEVNPQGGKETTGLVTRFSVQPQATPADFPVSLRLLRESDVVAILANSFVLDLAAEPDDANLFGTEALQALCSRFAAGTTTQPGLCTEDVYELREYVEHALRRHPLNGPAGGLYWQQAEAVLPGLDAAQRAELLAPLWGGLPEFTRAYRLLKDALDRLGHPEWAFVGLSAIRDRAAGILHVDTLMGLECSDAVPVEIRTRSQGPINLPRPVVTALTAELRVTLEAAPWAFLEHTDLLDFPGARSRADDKRVLRDPSRMDPDRPALANCFLRGKVAVLFDRYVADLDLNSMLLCVGPENQEVAKLPELVEDWVHKTHGLHPEDREGRRVGLFFCLTKCDGLFRLAAGESADLKLTNRFENNLRFFTGWTQQWTAGAPFTNCYLIRNPKAGRQDGLFDYASADGLPLDEVPDETAVRADQQGWLAQYRSVYLQNEQVRRHVADAEQRWEALLTLNDGGVTHLAERLAPVCDLRLKFEQIRPRALELSRQLVTELERFHEKSDVEQRVTERMAKASAIAQRLSRNPRLIGPLLQQLHATESALGQRFLEVSRQRPATADTPAGDSFVIDLDVLGLGSATPPPESVVATFPCGDAAIACWLETLERHASDTALCESVGLSPEQFQDVVSELAIASRRLGLPAALEDFVRQVEAFKQRPDEVVHRVGLGLTLLINRLVNAPGEYAGDQLPGASAPAYRRAVGEAPTLPADPRAMQQERLALPTQWLRGLLELTRTNASWGQGGRVDVEQNRRLGELIGKAGL
ncbi:MAG: putative virulence factor [Gammaproteobacteria bacterium]|nr:putative virulence factor [Gammaproteobacteria bacterium]